MTPRQAFLHQARNNESLGSPFTARVLTLLGERLKPGTPLTDRLFGWQGDMSSRGDSVPLRLLGGLLGGLHALVLTGAAPGLAAVYPPNPAPADAGLWAALETALSDHSDELAGWLDRPPQTNEVRRAAVHIAAGHWLTRRYRLPLVLSELGASAGLNLMWDRFALDLPGGRFGPTPAVLTLSPDWHGSLPPDATPHVADRRGVDLSPLDPHDPGDALRLTAYLWADQPDRLARTRAAIAVAGAGNGAVVDRADAADWLEQRLANPRPGHLHLVCNTVAWQYFPPETRARCSAAMERAGADPAAPVAHLAMEADQTGPGAALSLQIWPGGRKHDLGRADFHGRWVKWQAPSEDR